MDKEFAPQYPRNDAGWVLFPEDTVGIRQEIFPQIAIDHPAKYNFAMIESIIEYITEPGDIVMDIMAGSGTTILAAARGRNVICIEIEEIFQDVLYKVVDHMEGYIPGIRDKVTILCGDCRDFLPIPTNHIIFSPPYAQILTTRKAPEQESTKALAGALKGADGSWTPKYTENPRNVGRLNKFLYNQAIEKIYKLCYNSLLPNGTMTVVLKDYIKQGKRVYLSDWLIRTCVKMGFENIDWFKREALGTGFLKLWRSRGYTTVDDEDIVVFRKN